jgi:putative PIN family toxin of toxin-antitoxin system
VIVSALLFEDSVPGRAFYAALDAGQVLVSPTTFVELSDVLAREKFDRYVTREERDRFLAMFLHEAVLVEPIEIIRACRDPRDDKFLELAVSGIAESIVTGDQDLLVLHPFRGIPILTPATFLEALAAGGAGERERP